MKPATSPRMTLTQDGMVLLGGRKWDPGVYVWILEVEYMDGVTEILRGNTTLIRYVFFLFRVKHLQTKMKSVSDLPTRCNFARRTIKSYHSHFSHPFIL